MTMLAACFSVVALVGECVVGVVAVAGGCGVLEVWWVDVMSCSCSGWSLSVVAVVGSFGVLQLLWLVVLYCSCGGYFFFCCSYGGWMCCCAAVMGGCGVL